MSKYIRKNITMKTEDINTINDYLIKTNENFSNFLVKAALKYISDQENMELLEFLNNNCEYVSKSEQKYLDSMNIDYSDINGKEITLDDFLQN